MKKQTPPAKAPTHDPRRLDVRAFARAAARLEGQWPLAGFARLREVLAAADDGAPAGEVHWALQGQERAVRGGAAQAWVHLQAQTALPLQCQRCLGPTREELTLSRDYQFVADEAAAQALDEEVEHEVLVLTRDFDLHTLLEDELLLDLPLVPRHEVCPQPLREQPPHEPPPAAEEARDKPFAALAALRRGVK